MMCLIIDANTLAEVLAATPKEDYRPVKSALIRRKAVAFYGGKLRREYAKLAGLRRLILEYDRQGMLRRAEDSKVDAATDEYARDRRLKSNDPHILGLAKASNVRLLVSHDQNLHIDFTNPKLLSPAGQVYQNKSHKHLIVRHCKQHLNR
jgi:hypothetical protein